MVISWFKINVQHHIALNPACDQEKSSVAYCSKKNHNFANIGHKNMNEWINLNAKRLLYYNKIIIPVEQMKIMRIFVFEIELK